MADDVVGAVEIAHVLVLRQGAAHGGHRFGQLPLHLGPQHLLERPQLGVEVLPGVQVHALDAARHGLHAVDETPTLLHVAFHPLPHRRQRRGVLEGEEHVD